MRTTRLITIVMLLSALLIISNELGLPGYLSRDRSTLPYQIAAYVVFALNAAVGIVGLLTPDRPVWAAYLIASFAGMLLIGAATPITALWTLARAALGY